MDCKYYDKENGWCKLHSDWSEAMPIMEFCLLGPCGDYEELKPTYEELYEYWLKTKDKPKRKRKSDQLPGQTDMFDVIDSQQGEEQ